MIPIGTIIDIVLPRVIEGVTQLRKRNAEKKSTTESRLELLESGVSDLGKSVLQLTEALQATAKAFEESERERQALARKIKALTIALAITAVAAVGAVVASILR